MTKLFVDSNILIYFAQAEEEEKHHIANKFIDELTEKGEMCISVQNLAEFSRVMTEKAPKKLDFDEVNEFVARFSKFSQVLSYSSSTVILANSLAKKHKIHFFDALLAATMKENSVFEILTENVSDFNKVKGIKARNPFEK